MRVPAQCLARVEPINGEPHPHSAGAGGSWDECLMVEILAGRAYKVASLGFGEGRGLWGEPSG